MTAKWDICFYTITTRRQNG